jgi:O-antigen/teichoic acid export membrane protein
MRGPAIWDVTRSWVGGVLGIIVLFSGHGIIAYALVLHLAAVIPLVANGLRFWPIMRPARQQLDLAIWKKVIVGGFPFFIWSTILAFYATIDIPVLEGLAGSETVGWYALAYRWVSMPAFFAASVATAFFPALSAEGVSHSAAFTRMANGALRLVAFFATPAAVGIALIAHSFIARLYGPEFLPAVPLMRLLALHIPIVGLDIVLGSVLIAVDKQRQWVMVGVAAAIFNPLVNLVAIPMTERAFGNAAIGAATVTILTEIIMLFGAVLLRPAGVLDRATASVIGRIVVASITMVPVLLLLDTAPLALRVAAGVAVYAVASLLLKTISWREIRSRGRGWASTDTVPAPAIPPVTADL